MNQMSKVIVMGLLLGTSFPVSKFAIETLGVWPFRLVSSFSALMGLAIVFRKEVREFLLHRIDRAAMARLALLAVPNIFLVPTLNNFALSYTKASNALVLVYMMPPLLSVIQMVAQRRARIDSMLAALLSLSGIALLLKSSTFGPGEVLILLSATVWAFGTFFAGRFILPFPAAVTTLVQYLVSFFLVVLCAIFLPYDTPSAVRSPQFATLFWPIVLSIYVGFIANAIVFHLWFMLIRDRGAEFVAYASLISLIVGTLTSLVIFKETASVSLLVSLLLIISSVYIVQCRKKTT